MQQRQEIKKHYAHLLKTKTWPLYLRNLPIANTVFWLNLANKLRSTVATCSLVCPKERAVLYRVLKQGLLAVFHSRYGRVVDK